MMNNDRQDQAQDSQFALNTAVDVSVLPDLIYKVILVGESGVGKTKLLGRWVEDKTGDTSSTINVEFASKSFRVDGKIIKIQLWDTAGQEQYRAISRSYFRKAAGALIVYDVTRADSFARLEVWLKDIKEAGGNENTQILLIGNKIDLKEQREISTEKGIAFSRLNALNFMETSAKTGENVERAFQILLQDIYKLNSQFIQVEEQKPSLADHKTVSLQDDNKAETTRCCD